MKLTDREKHILQAVALIVITGCIILGVTVHDRITRLETEVALWQTRCDEWRNSTWYWENAYNDLRFQTEQERRGTKAELILLDAEPVPVVAPWIDIGECRITHYCPCEICCGKWAGGITAIGTKAVEGRTVAVDPNIIPLGSEVLIGDEIYIAEDTGVKGYAVDIFLYDHNRCIELGLYQADVKWRPAGTPSETINT